MKARFLSLARVVCIKEFMSGWFHGAHPDTIGRGNVEDFVAYGFYTRTKADLPREQRDAIEAFVREVERRWGVTFAAGRNPALRFMAHLWEPLRVIHKPLALHAACEAATLTSHAALWCAGFRKHHVAGFDYWYREPVFAPSSSASSAASASASASAAAVTTTTAAATAGATTEQAAPSAVPPPSAAPPAASSSSDVEDISRSPSDESGEATATARASSASEGEEAAAAARASSTARASSSSQQRAALNGNNGLWRRGDSFSSLAGRSPLRSRRSNTAGDASTSSAAEAAEANASAAPAVSTSSAAAAEELPSSATSPAKKRPVFFVHGVGFGLVPYLGLIALIARAVGRDRPLVLLEVPHVSLRFRSRRAQPVDDVAAAAVAVLARHGHEDAAFVAHSYGTFCVSRICQLHRRAVAAALLVDPVCCLTCYPHLLFNFVYKIPSMAAALAGGAAGALNVARFLFSRDLTIAETFCRRVSGFFPASFGFFVSGGGDEKNQKLTRSLSSLSLKTKHHHHQTKKQFLWHELMLWPEDMPPATVIALSHDDDLVPSPLVAAHLATAAPGVQVLYHPTASHGGVLLDFAFQRKMVNALAAVVDSPATSASAATAPAAPKGIQYSLPSSSSSGADQFQHQHAEVAAAQARALLAAKAERVAAAEAARGGAGSSGGKAQQQQQPLFDASSFAPRATPTTDAAIAAAVAAAGSSGAAAASAARRRARRDAVRSWG